MEEGRFDVLTGGHVRNRTAGGHGRSGVSWERRAGISWHRTSRLWKKTRHVCMLYKLRPNYLYSQIFITDTLQKQIQLCGVWTPAAKVQSPCSRNGEILTGSSNRLMFHQTHMHAREDTNPVDGGLVEGGVPSARHSRGQAVVAVALSVKLVRLLSKHNSFNIRLKTE